MDSGTCRDMRQRTGSGQEMATIQATRHVRISEYIRATNNRSVNLASPQSITGHVYYNRSAGILSLSSNALNVLAAKLELHAVSMV